MIKLQITDIRCTAELFKDGCAESQMNYADVIALRHNLISLMDCSQLTAQAGRMHFQVIAEKCCSL